MPKQIPQTGTPIAHASTSPNPTLHLTAMPVLFKAGDTVLCPSLDNDIHTLHQHGNTINFKHKVYFVDNEGEPQIFRPDGMECKGGEQVIFHDTPASRELIAKKYSMDYIANSKGGNHA